MSDVFENSNTRWTLDARGFKHGPERKGTYGGHVTVQESSAASRPCVWVRALEPEITRQHGSTDGEASVHLTVEQARQFAQDILLICDNHYQEESDERQDKTPVWTMTSFMEGGAVTLPEHEITYAEPMTYWNGDDGIKIGCVCGWTEVYLSEDGGPPRVPWSVIAVGITRHVQDEEPSVCHNSGGHPSHRWVVGGKTYRCPGVKAKRGGWNAGMRAREDWE